MDKSRPSQAPFALGQHLLVAMSNTLASLALVEHIAQHLPEPTHTSITLMHYLQPIAWEHGDDTEARRKLRDSVKSEEQALEDEQIVEKRTERYFDQASKVLQSVGVRADQIQTRLRWDDQDVANALLNELRSGQYTSVIVGQHHHDFLSRLLGLNLADILQRQRTEIKLWVIQDFKVHSV